MSIRLWFLTSQSLMSPIIKGRKKFMARPKKNLPPARTHRITIRLTDEMYDVVTRDAKAANLSNAEYIRQLILKRTIKYAPTIVHDDTKIIQELGAWARLEATSIRLLAT